MEFWKLTLQGLIWTALLVWSGYSDGRFDQDQHPALAHDCALRLDRSFSHVHDNPFRQDRGFPNSVSEADCIRFSDVNEALAEAKGKIRYKHPVRRNFDHLEPEDIDVIANVIIETTRILAQKFQLNLKEIDQALPTIDTSQTDIWDICPEKFKPSSCPLSRYRTIDGSCSKLRNSVEGASSTPFGRFVRPVYDDGIDAPRVVGVDGSLLPNVRVVSVSVHKDYDQPSGQKSILLSSWAQFLVHDLTSGAVIRMEDGSDISCCPEITHRICNPIRIPKNDPFYSRFNETCMDFQRTLAGLRPGCALGPRLPFNLVTTRIDVNFLYGSNLERHKLMRLGSKGLLRSWDKFRDLGLKPLLPPVVKEPETNCIARPSNKFCFLAGDERLNEQPDSVVLHTLFARYHNSIATELGYLNPHWDDEQVFQETRHIMIAVTQHITYNELLPEVLGSKFMEMYDITLQKEGYWQGYDEDAPMIHGLGFQSAAFRFGHTLVDAKLRMFNKNHKFVDSIDIHEVMRQPYILYKPGTIDKVIAGFLNAPAQNFDRFMSTEVTNRLFQEPTSLYGSDLAARNIMRGRDHGMPGYNDYREICGMARAQTFEELASDMSNGTAIIFSKLFKHPDDIDLFTAGLSERIVEGGVVGPTFACIIGRQFSRLRKGDRFWYENPGLPSSFTPGQLREIRKISQAKMICDQSDSIRTIQTWVMELPHPVHNPRIDCKELPAINLQYWIEDPIYKKFKFTE